MKINWNDIVTVKPTEYGWHLLKKYYADLNLEFPSHIKIEDQGTLTMELYEVAHIFGESLYSKCQMPFTSTYMNIVKT